MPPSVLLTNCMVNSTVVRYHRPMQANHQVLLQRRMLNALMAVCMPEAPSTAATARQSVAVHTCQWCMDYGPASLAWNEQPPPWQPHPHSPKRLSHPEVHDLCSCTLHEFQPLA
eukprot:GHUV01038519.1.p1 GENE.GHUV01038519.1~~GHUV01038519.1.p1  ORF type:complete len:114 (+),score=8.27 GHUV01038519.1:329-670(+)